MPKYRVLEKSYIGNRIVEEGDEIEYDGLPSSNLKPLDKAGEEKAAEYEATNAVRVQKMLAEHQPTPNVDAAAIAAAVAEGVKQVMAAPAAAPAEEPAASTEQAEGEKATAKKK